MKNALDQMEDRSLSGAGWPDDRHRLAHGDGEGDPIQHGIVAGIVEHDPVEDDGIVHAVPRARDRGRLFLGRDRLPQQHVDALPRPHRLDQQRNSIGDRGDRSADVQ